MNSPNPNSQPQEEEEKQHQQSYYDWFRDQYNIQYEKWYPWIEDQYLKWFGKGDNKASYVTKGKHTLYLCIHLPYEVANQLNIVIAI